LGPWFNLEREFLRVSWQSPKKKTKSSRRTTGSEGRSKKRNLQKQILLHPEVPNVEFFLSGQTQINSQEEHEQTQESNRNLLVETRNRRAIGKGFGRDFFILLGLAQLVNVVVQGGLLVYCW
jgi:hypothetical protein